jgi:hypothetical protein
MRRASGWVLATVGAVCAAGWALEVRSPTRIEWQAVSLPGCAAFKAEGLVLQQEDGDTVWASRGWDIYRSRSAGPFERVASVRPALGEAWGGYLRTLRRMYGYQELLEVVPLRPDLLLAFGGGAIYRLDLARGSQELVHTLRYFGRGKGRGVMSRIAVDDRGDVYFGEYSDVMDPHSIRIWQGADEARTWTVAYEFAPGQAEHVHGVQWDPYGRLLWVMTGDMDSESRIGFSSDRGTHFEWLGQGEQRFRACSLLFTPDAVLWATDTEENHLYRWSRTTREVQQLADMPAQSLYAEPLDDETNLVGQSAWDGRVYVVRNDGSMHAIARFTPVAVPHHPIPGVRLARGQRERRPWVYFNPLRTREEEATIYRVARPEVDSCSLPGST